MLEDAIFSDLYNYILGHVGYAKYRASNVFTRVEINDITLHTNGPVRVTIGIIPQEPCVIDRVEIYSTQDQLWACQDCNISVAADQTGVLYWFDFYVEEAASNE